MTASDTLTIPVALWHKRKRDPKHVAALLELAHDHATGNVRPTREYARLWGVTRKVARGLVDDWIGLHQAVVGQGPPRAHPMAELPFTSAELDVVAGLKGPTQGPRAHEKAHPGPTPERVGVRKVKDFGCVESVKGPARAHNY